MRVLAVKQLSLRMQSQDVSTYCQKLHQQNRLKSSVNVTANSDVSIFTRLWRAYVSALAKRPLSTKATAAALIFFSSDTATQYITDQSAPWDAVRSTSGAAFGIVATGWLHYWWGFLESFVGARLPVGQYRLANTMTKVFLDQAIGAPCYIYTYYVVTNFVKDMKSSRSRSNNEKQSQLQSPADIFRQTTDRASEMLMPTMMRHWTLWPLVHSINFYYIPLHHRVLVQNLVLIGWSGYLSHLNNGGLMTPSEEIKATIHRRETLIQDHP